jgi:hypothetical protein
MPGETTPSIRLTFSPSLLAALLIALAAACEPPAFGPVTPGEAPFLGPATLLPSPPVEQPETEPPPMPPAIPPAIETLPPPGFPPEPDLDDEAARRRAAWLGEPFRCKAISTTKLRGCRFEAHEGGQRIRFQVADVVCEDVVFDAAGDPVRLVDCKAGWLVMPRNVDLKKARGQDVWSGSHGGWRWRDKERYCCPGLWLEAPKSLRR